MKSTLKKMKIISSILTCMTILLMNDLFAMIEKQEMPYSEKTVAESWKLIQRSQKVTLLTHWKPDADGMSACNAMAIVLKKYGKNVEIIYKSAPAVSYKCGVQQEALIDKHDQIPDLLIALDTSTYGRMYYPEVFKKIALINIDHHLNSDIHGVYNFVNPEASSACEELFFILKAWNPALIDQDVAKHLLLGILSDTQCFHSQATTIRTLRVAADLMALGANLLELETTLSVRKSPQVIAFWGHILRSIKSSDKGLATWVMITQSDFKSFGLTPSCLVGFSEFLEKTSDTDVTIVFYETEDGKTKVALRSDKIDVNAIASQFGGGGHSHAAGLLIAKPIDQVIEMINQRL